MASSASSKTLMDLFQPASKRLKSSAQPASKRLKSSATLTTICKSVSSKSHQGFDDCSSAPNGPPHSSALTPEQKSRVEYNKLVARSKRNLKICIDKVSKCKDNGGYVKLEELLVEETWLDVLQGELEKPYAKNLCKFVEREICSGTEPIYPASQLIFNALNSTPFDRVKAVILGQDPYHGPGQAMGLSFSVPEGVKVPSSLVNIFKELKQDLGCSIPPNGNLEKWAVQGLYSKLLLGYKAEMSVPFSGLGMLEELKETLRGILLLNAVLTVRKHQANSHAKKGWEQFTDAIIKTISQKKEGVVFLLWGNSAQKKSRIACLKEVEEDTEKLWKKCIEQTYTLIDATKHHILEAAHPSGLSANRGFFGCRHFSRTNKILEQMGVSPIDWQL